MSLPRLHRGGVHPRGGAEDRDRVPHQVIGLGFVDYGRPEYRAMAIKAIE